MSEDALSRATRINDVVAQWRKKLAGEPNALQIIELLSANPFITATGAARRLSIAFTTAQRAIQRLEQKRVVRRTTDARRNRVYCAQELLDILEEPAQLKPISSV